MRATLRLLIVPLCAALLAAPARLAAQEPADDSGQTTELRQQIEDRFAARVQEELGLSSDQFAKLRRTTAEFAGRRRDITARERDLRRGLASQLRPGVAANQDSVSRLTDGLVDAKLAYAQTYRDELRALDYLTPVQRAQFFALRERLLQRMQEVRAQRQGQAAPGARPWRRRGR